MTRALATTVLFAACAALPAACGESVLDLFGREVGQGGRTAGGPCQHEPDCAPGSACLTGEHFPGGTCAPPCASSATCPAGTACIVIDDSLSAPVPNACLPLCEGTEQCRAGYGCRTEHAVDEGAGTEVCSVD